LSSLRAFAQPLLANLERKGSVALFKASVDVLRTQTGILATQ